MRRFVMGVLLCLGGLNTSQALTNMHWQHQQVLGYVKSGIYQTEVAQIIQAAKKRLAVVIDENKRKPSPQKLAIVLDIDETALSNAHMQELIYKYKLEEAIAWRDKYIDPPIRAVLSLYRYALENKVTVFFLTGRANKMRKGTVRNLRQAGYLKWKRLIMRKRLQLHETAEVYKSAARKGIIESGYRIVLNIGDQFSDLKGGYADYTYRLPNPFYYVV